MTAVNKKNRAHREKKKQEAYGKEKCFFSLARSMTDLLTGSKWNAGIANATWTCECTDALINWVLNLLDASTHSEFHIHFISPLTIATGTRDTALAYESFIPNYLDLIITSLDDLFESSHTRTISEMAPRHRQTYTQTHIMLMSPPLWLPFQNATGILYRRTVTNPNNISLVMTLLPSIPLCHAEGVSLAKEQNGFVRGLWHLYILRTKRMTWADNVIRHRAFSWTGDG